jgi:type IV secretory pathway VirB10-like protein
MSDQQSDSKATQAALIAKAQAARGESQQHPRLFYGILAAVIVALGIGVALFLSSPSAATSSSSDATNTTAESSPDTSYGQGTPPPIRSTAPTPGPGLRSTPNPGDGASPMPGNVQTQTSSGPASAPGAAPTPMGPRLVTVYQQGASSGAQPPQGGPVQGMPDQGASAAPPAGDNMAAQAALLRQQIMAMEASHGLGPGATTFASTGGASSYGVNPSEGGAAPGYQAAPQAGGGNGDNGAMNTPFYAPEEYEVPMGSHVSAIIDGTTDSSLAGTVIAHIASNKRDPRTGALIIPRGSTLMGNYVGLTPGAGHLALAWTWLVYPDLCKRPLQRVTTADQEGSSGVPGHVDAHLWAQFRNTLVDSVIGSAGQIIANAVSHGTSVVGVVGSGGIQTQPSQAADLPTLYAGRDTPFDLILQADFNAPHPYRGDGQCSYQ